MPKYGVIYFVKVLQNKHLTSIELPFADPIVVKYNPMRVLPLDEVQYLTLFQVKDCVLFSVSLYGSETFILCDLRPNYILYHWSTDFCLWAHVQAVFCNCVL